MINNVTGQFYDYRQLPQIIPNLPQFAAIRRNLPQFTAICRKMPQFAAIDC
jgi:hypothetical protein